MGGHEHDHESEHKHDGGEHSHGDGPQKKDDRGHDHGAGGHSHSHAPPDKLTAAFAIGIVLNIVFVIIGVIAGLIAHSTALLADAAHNMGDVLGLAMAWGAIVLAKRVRTKRRTYGLRRTTILAALLNGGLVLFAIGGVVWESIVRLGESHDVDGVLVAIVAAIGVVLNGVAATLFAKGREKDINVRGAYLHLVADAAVSAGVVVAGIVVWKTGWSWVDPVTSLVVSAVILFGTWKLLRESMSLLMDAVPPHIDPEAVEKYLASLSDVRQVHDLHVWSMSTTEVALTVHLVLPWPVAAPAFLQTVQRELQERFAIHHATIQLEELGGVDCAQASGAV